MLCSAERNIEEKETARKEVLELTAKNEMMSSEMLDVKRGWSDDTKKGQKLAEKLAETQIKVRFRMCLHSREMLMASVTIRIEPFP